MIKKKIIHVVICSLNHDAGTSGSGFGGWVDRKVTFDSCADTHWNIKKRRKFLICEF